MGQGMRARGKGCRIYSWDSYSIVILLEWHLEQCGRCCRHNEGYYEMDISAHSPRPLGSNNTSQITLQMRKSLSWDKTRGILCGDIYFPPLNRERQLTITYERGNPFSQIWGHP